MCLPRSAQELLKAIDVIVKQSDEELRTVIAGQVIDPDRTVEIINEYEEVLDGILRDQMQHYTDFISQYDTVAQFAVNGKATAFASDDFDVKIQEANLQMLTDYMLEFVPEYYMEQDKGIIIKAIDAVISKEKFFATTTNRTIDWMTGWSDDLGKLMKITSQDQLTKKINEALGDGKSIDWLVREIEDLPGFNRRRARVTAITEVLTADSYAKDEAYITNPVVLEYKWKHTGGHRIQPRQNHVDLSGTTIPKGELFQVSTTEQARFPRDTQLSAKERVNCHCTFGTVQDADVLGLSNQERLRLREDAIANLNEDWSRTADAAAVARVNGYIEQFINPLTTYQAASTLAGARKAFKEITGATKSSFAGIPLELANEVNQEVFDFLQEYPELIGYIDELKVVKANTFFAKMRIKVVDNHLKKELVLSKSLYESTDTLDDLFADQVQGGMMPLQSTSADIIRHELTHALEYYMFEVETGLINNFDVAVWNANFKKLKNSIIAKEIVSDALTEFGINQPAFEYGAISSISRNAIMSRSETIADAAMIQGRGNDFADEIIRLLNIRLRGE